MASTELDALIRQVGRSESFSARTKRYISYIFFLFFGKWVLPVAKEINQVSSNIITEKGITNYFFKLLIYIAVGFVKLLEVLVMKIISADAELSSLASQISQSSFPSPSFFLKFAEGTVLLLIIYYVVVGWKLPIIQKDLSLQSIISWSFFQGHRNKDTLIASLLVLIAFWEINSLMHTSSFTLPFEGASLFIKASLSKIM